MEAFKAIEYVHEDVIALDMFSKQIATGTRTYCLIFVSLAQLKQARLVSSLVTCTNRELDRIVDPYDMKRMHNQKSRAFLISI